MLNRSPAPVPMAVTRSLSSWFRRATAVAIARPNVQRRTDASSIKDLARSLKCRMKTVVEADLGDNTGTFDRVDKWSKLASAPSRRFLDQNVLTRFGSHHGGGRKRIVWRCDDNHIDLRSADYSLNIGTGDTARVTVRKGFGPFDGYVGASNKPVFSERLCTLLTNQSGTDDGHVH